MSIELERSRMSQVETLRNISRQRQLTDMVTVYELPTRDNIWSDPDFFVFCALIPSDRVEDSLSASSWDCPPEDGFPCAIGYHEDGNRSVRYFRFGNDQGIEPLVFRRNFYGLREDYLEISEEFRLFHNLYYDRRENRYIKIDDDGDEMLVAVIENHRDRVQIRLKELRQFLAIKEMHLAVQFDHRVNSKSSLSELGISKSEIDKREDLCHWNLYYGDLPFPKEGYKTVSILHGKRFLEPLPKSRSGFPGFADEPKRKYVNFIIGLDNNGNEVEHTCDSKLLSNDFGANPGAPNFLTLVDFHKQVLDKYYGESNKYEVTDGLLTCGYLWDLRMDNHHDEKVSMWLGDLAALPYREQLYWRSYNFVSGTGISSTYFQRQILGETGRFGAT